ncbi:hypothetical protein BS50DRAFT_675322 [Corynespora cassiicola Philippines]|uniref:Uncharacterized protein n=1 Tax=Corynespora cassiicola Philippines TaxID=1448308 RepID=A0A2T2NUY2_CORCC|nr:hypothetical protein BS50DRAFT_675322 [Corynespora cassiicola Philippines]
MDFYDQAKKVFGKLGQNINEHISRFKNTQNKEPPYNCVDHWKSLETLRNFGEDVAKCVGATADDIWESLLTLGETTKKYTGPAAEEAKRHMEIIGKKLSEQVDTISEDASKIDWESLPSDALEWAKNNPDKVVAMIAMIAGPLIARAAVPHILEAFGYAQAGVRANSIASQAHSAIGFVQKGSWFSTFQSAGSGGAALGTVQNVVGGAVGVAGAGANVPIIMEAVHEGQSDDSGKARKKSKSKL